MQLPVTQDVLISELETSKKYLEEWIEKVKEGIPGVDRPAPPDVLDDFLRSLCGELLVVSGKCENLSHVLSGD